MQATDENNFLRKRHTTTIAFAVGILLFLLPFVEIKCNDVTMAQNTGIGLAIGSDYKMAGEMKSLQNSFEDREDKKSNTTKESSKMYIVALAALLLGVVGVVLSFSKMRSGMTNTLIGALAAIALIILMIQVKGDVKDKAGADESEMKVIVSFTIWYYLSIISFLAAAFFNYKRGQSDAISPYNAAPANAPQVKIENPGDQSEFPKSASESELG